MSGENKIIWGTVALAIIGIVAVFGLLIVMSPKELTDQEKAELMERDDSFVFGNSDSKVTIVAFEDFQCPACGLVQPIITQIKTEYKDKIKFVFRHFPLRTIHPNAQKSSEAAEAAGAQNKFYEMNDVLFAKQTEWSSLSGDELLKKFSDYAKEIEVADLEKFSQELENGTHSAKVQRDLEDGELLGVTGTPTIYINGEKVLNPTYEAMKSRIDSLL